MTSTMPSTMASTMHEAVRLTRFETGVAEILIDRPERHNAMSLPMYEALLACIAQCQSDDAVRCVMFRGAGGKSFIAGTDIEHFTTFERGEDGVAYEAFVEKIVDAVERLRMPTIAVIDGWAVGGGLALATACDFRVCTERSQFGVPIAKTLSNTLSSANIARLLAAFGVPRVKRMLLLAEFVSAEEAKACAYAYELTSPEALQESAHSLAGRLVALSPVTQKAVRESVRRIVAEQRLDDVDLITTVYGSNEFKTRVAAFIARGAKQK